MFVQCLVFVRRLELTRITGHAAYDGRFVGEDRDSVSLINPSSRNATNNAKVTLARRVGG